MMNNLGVVCFAPPQLSTDRNLKLAIYAKAGAVSFAKSVIVFFRILHFISFTVIYNFLGVLLESSSKTTCVGRFTGRAPLSSRVEHRLYYQPLFEKAAEIEPKQSSVCHYCKVQLFRVSLSNLTPVVNQIVFLCFLQQESKSELNLFSRIR